MIGRIGMSAAALAVAVACAQGGVVVKGGDGRFALERDGKPYFVKGAGGGVTGLRIVGRGWADKLKAIEEKERAAGRNATALEVLRDRLKMQSVFGKGPKDVRITGQKDVEAYLIEFTIEATLAEAASKDTETK